MGRFRSKAIRVVYPFPLRLITSLVGEREVILLRVFAKGLRAMPLRATLVGPEGSYRVEGVEGMEGVEA